MREVGQDDRGNYAWQKKGNRKRQNYENVKTYCVHERLMGRELGLKGRETEVQISLPFPTPRHQSDYRDLNEPFLRCVILVQLIPEFVSFFLS